MKKILVMAAAALFVFGMSTPSWAVADFAIGASVRIDAGWQLTDLGDQNEPGGEDSQTQFFLQRPGNSRINFKATVGDVTGFVEFSDTPTLRHAYASWDMGGGSSMLFGQTWSIMAFGFTDQRLNGDLANIGFGTLYFGRNPQIRYTYAGEAFTVEVAIEDNDKSTALGPAGSAAYLAEDFLPMFIANVTFKPLEMLTLTPSAFYQSFDLTGIAPGTSDVDIDSFGFALDGRVDFEMFRISFEGWIGENLGVAASSFDIRPAGATVGAGVPVPDAAATDVEDVSSWGGFVQLTFRFEPAILNIGGGFQSSDVESSPGASFEDEIETASYFINVLYNLTDNFYVQPEISYFDYGDDATRGAFGPAGTNDLGDDIFLGVHFQADF
ncbi:MAG: hypothetical protein GTN81_11505 [Proteobacteria bacterium]|nr:hypothetical protein [Pseudomonadota bacterium]